MLITANRAVSLTVFYAPNTGTVGSYPTRSMAVYPPVFVPSCWCAGFHTGWSLHQGVIQNICKKKIRKPSNRSSLAALGSSPTGNAVHSINLSDWPYSEGDRIPTLNNACTDGGVSLPVTPCSEKRSCSVRFGLFQLHCCWMWTVDYSHKPVRSDTDPYRHSASRGFTKLQECMGLETISPYWP